MNSLKKGFTLIELLVVIAILAILATVIVVIINPVELLRQARDATRMADMAALNSAIALYLSDVSSPGLGGQNNAACASFTSRCTFSTTTTTPFATPTCGGISTSTAIIGTGWVTIDFAQISSGSPLSKLPLDPVNNAAHQYAYACNGTNYHLGATMESNRYTNATSGVTRNDYDGGSNTYSASWYEVGNSLSL